MDDSSPNSDNFIDSFIAQQEQTTIPAPTTTTPTTEPPKILVPTTPERRTQVTINPEVRRRLTNRNRSRVRGNAQSKEGVTEATKTTTTPKPRTRTRTRAPPKKSDRPEVLRPSIQSRLTSRPSKLRPQNPNKNLSDKESGTTTPRYFENIKQKKQTKLNIKFACFA